MQFNWKFNCFCGRNVQRVAFYIFTFYPSPVHEYILVFFILILLLLSVIYVCRALNLDVSSIEICHRPRQRLALLF